ncbi:YjgN family protein [Methylorubrum salsuginis]|uniref:Uncharacterized membrane protein YjgN, DUF898 family n=1 Tax=Methylorubrum salsuginis TaxID=414703 RepID=A0A1I4K6Y3_9HYPH|nr:YjgN family protein [Methylorubrum salsuginis]SFL74572.1 Uncharacterized membrane protein YjgN, DUF898 family [Methylorubrum salsuginis]
MNHQDVQLGPTGTVTFDRTAAGLTGIVVKGFLLSLVTFSIYRFWYITNLRRFFWSRTIVAGSPAEYLGRGKELFLGFLVALAILVPVYLVLFILGFAVPILAPAVPALSAAFLFLLGQYAIFRGRRYRASRTRWRGIRLSQDGSALAYMLRAGLWWLATILSLGLAFPFMRASLERYRIDHTLIGESRLRSTATGRSVLLPWLMFYLFAVAPLLLTGLGLLSATGFDVPTDLYLPDPAGKKTGFDLNPKYSDTPLEFFAVASMVALGFSILAVAFLIPYYRAREARAFLTATHLGEARLVSHLKARQFYWPYIIYFLSVIGFFIVVGFLFAMVMHLLVGEEKNPGIQAAVYTGAGLLYVATLLGAAVLYARVVTLRLWHAVASTTEIENAAALDAVLASAYPPGSGLNEGLADALDVGGALEIGF